MKKILKSNKILFSGVLFLSVVYAAGSVVVSKILKNVIDTALEGDFDRFKQIIIFAVGYMVVLGMAFYIYSNLSKKFVSLVSKEYRKQVFNQVLKKIFLII